MKITKSQLKQIIKEEIEDAIEPQREKMRVGDLVKVKQEHLDWLTAGRQEVLGTIIKIDKDRPTIRWDHSGKASVERESYVEKANDYQ